MRVISLALCLASITAAGCAGAHPGASSSDRTATVHGSATIRLVPDRVAFSVGVETRGASVSEAFRTNGNTVKSVLDALRKKGVDSKEIQTSDLDMSGVVVKGRTVGYRVSNLVTVTLENPDRVGDLLQVAVIAGANQVGGPRFSLSDAARSRKEGLDLAFANARSKAETLASLSHLTLGPVIAVSDDSRVADGTLLHNLRSLGYASEALQSGTNEQTFNVSVIYELK